MRSMAGDLKRMNEVVRRRRLERIQRLVMDLITNTLVFLVLIAPTWAVVTVADGLIRSVGQPSFERFKVVTLEILTIFVFIEMFTLPVEYVNDERLRMTNLVDATLAVVLRELWVQLYAGHSGWQMLLGLSGVLIALAILRDEVLDLEEGVHPPSSRSWRPLTARRVTGRGGSPKALP